MERSKRRSMARGLRAKLVALCAGLLVALPAAAADTASPGAPATTPPRAYGTGAGASADRGGGAPAGISRSGIPYLSDAQVGPPDLVASIRARRPGGKLLNLDRMLLHSPAFAKGWNAMFGAIRGQLAVPPRLRELAIMAIGVLNHAEYEWAQHEGEFLKAGGTHAQLATLRTGVDAARKDTKLFDDRERATLSLTYEMTRDITVQPETMKQIRALLPDDHVVELIGTISGYNMVSRFVVATGVEIER